ncbi:MAG: CoA transferase subunit A [Chloroflexota bacterium]|nr:MAG: CoA transferase subunit A [Chloroflexota bacterium]
MNKQMTMEQAAALVPSGCMLALGGMTLYRRPVAFVRELLRRHSQTGQPDNLTLLAFTASLESDLLVGAGMVRQVRSCYFGLEIFGLAPMFTYCANRGDIEILEETEASLAFGLRAQMAGVGFMPGRAWVGTDLPRLRPDVRTVVDPYSGEELMAFPAIKPDVAVIHALKADLDGNALIGINKAVDEELALTSTQVIVTAEEVVSELSQADLVAPVVSAVVHAPGGARPTSCHPLYSLDGEALLDYTAQVSDPASFALYLAGINA